MTPTAVDAPEETVVLNGIPAKEIRSQLDLILRSRSFIQSHRVRRFLEFVVQESLFGRPHRLKEYLIGLEVFDRQEAFDPRVDSIVRVEARRLRHKLDEYYRSEGREDSVRIVLHKGSYVPTYEYQTAGGSVAAFPQRRSIEIAPFCRRDAVRPRAGSVADEIPRRLAHVLIREGCFQVMANSKAKGLAADGNGNGNGHGSIAAATPDYIVQGSLELHADHFHLDRSNSNSAPVAPWFGPARSTAAYTTLRSVEQLAQSLVRDLLAPTSRRRDGPPTGRLKRVPRFLPQGRYHWKIATPGSIRESVAFFIQAVESDSSYAAAWAALAEALLVSSMFGLDAPADVGRTHEGSRGEGRCAQPVAAGIARCARLRLVDSGLGLDRAASTRSNRPSSWTVTTRSATWLIGIHLACRGMLDAAIAEVELALEADPAALFGNFVLGWLYGVNRRFDDAIAQHLLVSRLAPDYGLPHLGLGLACAGKGEFSDAIAHLTNASQMKCRSLLEGQMGYCYARAGRREEALRETQRADQSLASSYVSPVSIAAIYAGLGETRTGAGLPGPCRRGPRYFPARAPAERRVRHAARRTAIPGAAAQNRFGVTRRFPPTRRRHAVKLAKIDTGVVQIGRYRILDELGRGATGIVYRAQDPAIGRIIAIKTIRLSDFTDETERDRLRERLFREAQSAGILSHPNIVTIYDIAEENGMAYIFMECVDGPPLEKVSEQRSMRSTATPCSPFSTRPRRRSITRTRRASSIATSSPPIF